MKSQKQPAYDPAAVLAALANSYESNDDDAQVTLFDGSGPWTQVAINNALLLLDGWLSAYFVGVTNDSLYGYYDPRLPAITNKTDDGFYRGTQNGAGHTGSTTDNGRKCAAGRQMVFRTGRTFADCNLCRGKIYGIRSAVQVRT